VRRRDSLPLRNTGRRNANVESASPIAEYRAHLEALGGCATAVSGRNTGVEVYGSKPAMLSVYE